MKKYKCDRGDVILKNKTQVWELFWFFFRIGWFTFGGGWSIVAQMQDEFVKRRELVTSEEMLDLVSVGRSMPGTMIGNVAYLFGYHQCGLIGGIASVLGIITPPLVILSILTFCYSTFRDNVWVAKALTGVRSAVVPIIATAAVNLRKGAFPVKVCFLICAIACLLSLFFQISCILLVCFGIIAGLLIGAWEGRRV